MLCAGSPNNHPAELITSKRMQEFLREIKHRYPDRIIIIDTLPLVPFAESRSLSRMVDGILLVVRENVTVKAHLESALNSLQGCPVSGIVYNGASNYGADKEVFELAFRY
jgi:Mrp family chromosome partitioning ATPase